MDGSIESGGTQKARRVKLDSLRLLLASPVELEDHLGEKDVPESAPHAHDDEIRYKLGVLEVTRHGVQLLVEFAGLLVELLLIILLFLRTFERRSRTRFLAVSSLGSVRLAAALIITFRIKFRIPARSRGLGPVVHGVVSLVDNSIVLF